jgi:hypothetical protein
MRRIDEHVRCHANSDEKTIISRSADIEPNTRDGGVRASIARFQGNELVIVG